ncbi:MAG: hypothetical protein L3J28_14760 [Candidatus Polarisedimenticolaceae bacterium]|nr:hypothetical protein [Candidatus Polarisedimenticolaceae bacterium]
MVRHLIIITWLVISILGYGMAIAADVHDEETQVMAVGDVTTSMMIHTCCLPTTNVATARSI